MKQRDLRASGDGVRSSRVGAVYVDQAGLGKTAVCTLCGKVHSEIRHCSKLEGIVG